METQSEQPVVEERASAAARESQPAPPQADGKVQGPIETVQVLFAFDRADLNKSALSGLQSVIEKLRQNPRLTVELEGYADSAGARDYNLRLSQKRVEAVRGYLVEQGVEATRIRSAGLGQLPDSGKEEERAKNRRVTIKLMPTVD